MKRRPFIIAGMMLAIALLEFVVGVVLSGGRFAYPLDDTYIHMAMAREFATSGTWGLEAGVPVFASSSPLWTLVLASVFKVFGFRILIPLVLAALFAFLALAFVVRHWLDNGVSVAYAWITAGLFPLCVPLVSLVNLGMEHALHFLLIVLVLIAAERILRGDSGRRDLAMLALWSLLATGARYESLFITFPVAVILAVERRFSAAVVTVVASAAAVCAFGFYALACGGPFLPVSVLMKGGVSGLEGVSTAVFDIYKRLSADSVHAVLTLLFLAGAAALPAVSRRMRSLALGLAVAVGGHLVFARLGWLYRYEAYLLGAAFMMIPPMAAGISRFSFGDGIERVYRKSAMAVVAVALGFPFVFRGLMANVDTILAQREICGQQVQVARLFRMLPPELKGPIAVNDLGCAAWDAGVHILDIWGLGSPEVAELRMKGKMTTEICAGLFKSHHIRYAAFYPNWYRPEGLSPDLKVVARLEMLTPRVICGGDTVFLAVMRPEDVAPFKARLSEWAEDLPPTSRLVVLD